MPLPPEPTLPVLSPPVAVTVPPEMVRLPLLVMPSPPEVSPLPPVRWFSPFRVSVTSPFEVRAGPELASMFTSLSVTSTLSFLPLALMVTVWEEAVSLSRFVMTVSVSFSSVVSPCETLFVPSVLPAFTVMLPSSMYHVPAKAGAARVVSIAAVRTSAAAR